MTLSRYNGNAQAISSYGEKAYLYYLEYSGDFGTEVQNI